MGESDRKEEPEYMIVLDRIYQKGPAVAYPNLPHSSEDLITMTPDQRREQDLQREMVSHDIPRDKDLLPISSLADYEISQAIESLKRVGLVKETNRINGIRRDSDLINYIKLTPVHVVETVHWSENQLAEAKICRRRGDGYVLERPAETNLRARGRRPHRSIFEWKIAWAKRKKSKPLMRR